MTAWNQIWTTLLNMDIIGWKVLVLIDCRYYAWPLRIDTKPFNEVGEGRPVEQARLERGV